MEFVRDKEGNIGMNVGYFETLLMPAKKPNCKLTELRGDALADYVNQRFARVFQEVANEFGDADAEGVKYVVSNLSEYMEIEKDKDKIETLDMVCFLEIVHRTYLREQRKKRSA